MAYDLSNNGISFCQCITDQHPIHAIAWGPVVPGIPPHALTKQTMQWEDGWMDG